MFYEERVIDGRLKWRGTPDGDWVEFSYEKLTERIVYSEQTVKMLAEAHKRLDR